MIDTQDPVTLALVMQPYADETEGFDPWDWFNHQDNHALWDGDTSMALLQGDGPGVFWVHTYYTLRGKEAIDYSKSCLPYVFNELGAKVLKGATPVEKRAARLAARKTGFKSHGITETVHGPCEIFILTKDEWESK